MVALAVFRDGTQVPVNALWEPPTAPSALSGNPDRAEVFHALVTGRRQRLAARG